MSSSNAAMRYLATSTVVRPLMGSRSTGVWLPYTEADHAHVPRDDLLAALPALLADLTAGAPGPVRMDIDHRRPEVLAWAGEHGLAHRFTTAVMVLGADLAADPNRGFTPVMLALG